MSLTITEKCQTIRTDLKRAFGITSRQVSVRKSPGGAINCTIHDDAVDVRDVLNVAARHKSVRYCEVSGEILSGGNVFLSVGYSEKAAASYLAKHLPEITAAIAGRDCGEGATAVMIDGQKARLLRDSSSNLCLWYGDKRGHIIWESTLSPAVIASELLHLRQ
jgi:hypothetical protein